MRRLVTLAGIAVAMLVAPFTTHAQQPMQRVQVGILECRGGASIGFIVGSVTHLGCVLRVDGMPEDRYVATIRKVGVDLGITQEIGAGLGRLRAIGPAWARRSLRQLRRRGRQRSDRRRCWRQCAGRWLEQFDRAAAAQRAGPGRLERRGRAGKPGTSAGKVILLSRPSPGACACAQAPTSPRKERGEVKRLASHRSDVFPACQILDVGGASICRPNQGPSST